MGAVRRKENDVIAKQRQPARAGCLSQDAFAAIAIDRVTEPLGRHERDARLLRSLTRQHRHADERRSAAAPLLEDALKGLGRLERSHGEEALAGAGLGHGEALAALGTTAGEHLTTGGSGHAGTEAVALGALPLIGLVRTLHWETLLDTAF